MAKGRRYLPMRRGLSHDGFNMWEPSFTYVHYDEGSCCPICELLGISVEQDGSIKAKTPTLQGERSLGPTNRTTDGEPCGTELSN